MTEGVKTWPHPRDFTRLSISRRFDVSAHGQTLVFEDTRDICLRGVYVFGTVPFALETEVDVRLHLGEGDETMPLDLRGRIVRAEAEGCAIEFTEMAPEVYHHLKQLLLNNSPDSGKLEEEFGEHLGLKKR